MDARHEALLPKEITSRMAHDQMFRIFHKHGSVIVMAKSETDKAVWLSALEHHMKLKKTAHLKNVTASNRIVHEASFLQLYVLLLLLGRLPGLIPHLGIFWGVFCCGVLCAVGCFTPPWRRCRLFLFV